MTLIDYFKAFHSLKGTLNLSAGSQAVYFSLLGEFNAARFPEQLKISTRELKALAGLKSTNAVIENRNVLKNKKLIDFQTKNGVTTYSLSTEHLLNTCRTLTEQSLNTFENPNIHARDKTEDVKTKDLSAPATARARAPVNYDIDKLVERWESSEAFGKIDMLIVAKLTALLKTYSVDEILSAMDKAILSNDNRRGINYNYFEAILKGGEKNARVGGQSRVNRPNVLNFAAQRTAINSGVLQAGKGRFDDDPEYN